jgi:GNAT superfamily N-acetyltransferase
MSTNNAAVTPTAADEVSEIFRLFDHSILYQERNGYPSWRNYDRDAVIKDIENRRQFKVMINQRIAIVFSIRYDDKVIWREHDNGESIYLHRIVVNPEFKGQKLFGRILHWAIAKCKEKGLKNVRMDTWADNPKIIQYYKGFGFEVVENYKTPNTAELPVHNRNLALTLLEYKVA